MTNETTPLVSISDGSFRSDQRTPSFGGSSGKEARRRISSTKQTSNKATQNAQPVLAHIFEVSQRSLSDRYVKSWLYTLLNPKSLQRHAVCFKYFIAAVIILDFIFYVFSTEPVYQTNPNPLFDIEEGITSYIFLFEYLARLITVVENRKYRDPIAGRLKYIFSFSALIDLFATVPFFLDKFTGRDFPQLTYLRVFRLFRILKTNAFMKAGDAVRRVLYYNRQIMTLSVFVGLIMVLITSILMYQLRPRETESKEFESILSTMYLATLMLTGQGGPEGDLPWYTKGVVLLTSAFSIGMFAIPVSMLTWGFEAEAARCAKRSRILSKRRRDNIVSGDNETSTDEYSTDEDYQRIIAGEESSDEDETSEMARAMHAAFKKGDVDGSGTISFQEFVKLSQSRTLQNLELQNKVSELEDKLDLALAKIDQLCQHFAIRS